MQQLIVFRVQQEWFGLPIQTVCKVIPMGQIYGAPQAGGMSLMHYQNQEILVIDVIPRIFKRSPTRSLPASATTIASLPSQPSNQPHLLIVQNQQKEFIGIPLDSPPSLRRVPQSAFTPLSSTYLAQGNIQCVCALVVAVKDEPPLFLLNLDQLLQTQPLQLPSAESRQGFEGSQYFLANTVQALPISPSETP